MRKRDCVRTWAPSAPLRNKKNDFKDMQRFVKEVAGSAKMSPTTVMGMAAEAASASGGDTKIVKDAIRASAPHARFWKGEEKTLARLVADLVEEGFTGPGAMRHIVELQRQVHTTELPKLEHSLRAVMSGGMLSQGNMTKAQRIQVVEEMSSMHAAMSRVLKETGGQVSGTAAAGAIASIYKKFEPQLRQEYGDFVSPFQAFDWAAKAGVIPAMQWEDFFGEATTKNTSWTW